MREMKDSGVAWIGEIPKIWESVPAGGLFTEVKEKNTTLKYTNPLQFKYGEIVDKNYVGDLDANMLNTLQTYSCVEPDTIMINGLNLNYDFVSQRVAIVTKPGVITSAYLGVVPNENLVLPYYACYLLKGYDGMQVFHGMGSGVRKTLQWKDFKILRFVLPPLPEQRRIADYLDTACGKVDALIANQQAQIEKLRAYKQSLITEVVTHGLDPDAPVKDSGVEWIGRIPEGWEVIRGKFALKLMSRPTMSTDDVITCFRDGEVTLRKNRREEGFTFSDKEIGYQGIEPGDLVIHGMDGFAGAIGISDSRGKGSPVLIVCDSKNNKKYLAYYLRNLAYRNIFVALATGIRVRSCDLRWNKLSVLPFVLPPISEQQQIADYLDNKCAKIDALIAIKQQKIEKLTEYKKSLIYEYVTGKKEA